MCAPITCRQCGKVTWSGCGQHVAEVKAMVGPDQWCDGHDQVADTRSNVFGFRQGR
ncbi:hypothetical protein IEQ44_06470 [Nocardioides sp. Y6]|uniref:Uncharacterized protein n=1 Tax=Nocardioides malaquae TaxID=2773426 RepID=A0ABR9RRV8_9ACTN|nr:hypothetical protein [Nocardioides malaquae]MBE7324291.1 hypothetical protein [Nocardioides malaquae]